MSEAASAQLFHRGTMVKQLASINRGELVEVHCCNLIFDVQLPIVFVTTQGGWPLVGFHPWPVRFLPKSTDGEWWGLNL